MVLEKARIYGVDRVGKSNPNLSQYRTDDAVGLSWFCGENGEIYSDFDRCYPWCDMTEVTDERGNVFIRVPKFYSKITQNADGTYKYQISGVRYEGFSTLFVAPDGGELDQVYVGKYEASFFDESLHSVGGKEVNTTMHLDCDGFHHVSFRDYAVRDGYQLYDVWIDAMIKQLFLVEFATTNCQSVMRGAVDLTAFLPTGGTDHIRTPSGGTGADRNGCFSCKYRGIENPWGNAWTLVDGIRFHNEEVYVCYDPAYYDTSFLAGYYQYVGDRSMDTNSAVCAVAPFERIPVLGFVSALQYSREQYFSDWYYSKEGECVLAVGGWAGSGDSAGLWYCHGNFGGQSSDGYRGARLCLKGELS